MVFRHPHVSMISFCVEIEPERVTDVVVIETDLHLNARHPDYDGARVQQLIHTARAYLSMKSAHATHIRLISNRSAQA